MSSKKLFVGNLSFQSTSESLKSFFESCGAVVSAKIITDKATGRSKGFGFVEMSADNEAQDAIAKLNGQNMDGRNITVAEAKPQEGGGGGGGGGFRGPRRDFGGGGGGGRRNSY